MGRRYEEVSDEMKLVPYHVVRGENGDARVEIMAKKYSPPKSSAMILTKLKEAGRSLPGAEGYRRGHQPCRRTSTTPRRQATKDAGKIAAWT